MTRPLIITLVMLFLILQYELWFGNGSVYSTLQLQHKISLQQAKNDGLQKQNLQLIAQIKSLKNNTGVIETKARNDLGMVKKGEVFYQVVK